MASLHQLTLLPALTLPLPQAFPRPLLSHHSSPCPQLPRLCCPCSSFDDKKSKFALTASLHNCSPASGKGHQPFRILISTGDVMGDVHGAALVKQLLTHANQAAKAIEVYALGGHRIKDAGAVLIGDNTGLSSIGVVEAIPFILPSLRIQMITRAFLHKKPPDVVVLIDYPGVNIPFAQYLKRKFDCKIIYYIPPNEWLVFTARTPTIVQISDLILSVYPGETDYYRKAGGNVLEIGHPLVDRTEMISYKQAREKLGITGDDIVIALVPASREQELKHVWPLIASAAKLLLQNVNKSSSIRFFVPVVLSNRVEYLEKSLKDNGLSQHAQIWDGTSDTVLAASDLAIAKSGSVNLELALYNVPQVVVYKLSGLTAWILRNVFQFSAKHISLVNLILGEQLVPELIQENATVQNIMEAAVELLPCNNSKTRRKVLEGYQRLRSILGQSGVAARAANIILSFLNTIEV